MLREPSLKTDDSFTTGWIKAAARAKRPSAPADALVVPTERPYVDPRFPAPPSVATHLRGRDGKRVLIPAGAVAVQGRDGRVVAIPSGSGSLEGSDGRMVVIPPGHLGIENAKGRVVPKARW